MKGIRWRLCTDLYLRSKAFYLSVYLSIYLPTYLLHRYRKFSTCNTMKLESMFDIVLDWCTEGMPSLLYGLFGGEETEAVSMPRSILFHVSTWLWPSKMLRNALLAMIQGRGTELASSFKLPSLNTSLVLKKKSSCINMKFHEPCICYPAYLIYGMAQRNQIIYAWT